jgi:hypothetical protein
VMVSRFTIRIADMEAYRASWQRGNSISRWEAPRAISATSNSSASPAGIGFPAVRSASAGNLQDSSDGP